MLLHPTTSSTTTLIATTPTATAMAADMNTVIFGTGEYVTGWTGAEGSRSDKSLGVVALVHFDLRRRGLIGDRIALCGTNGDKFADIRKHFADKMVFSNLPDLGFEQFPVAGARDPKAYLDALDTFAKPGDVCSVFTPDDSHFEIISAALDRGLHVMATKPMVKTLKEHQLLVEKAKAKNVLLQIEVHKRFDPIYSDARMRIQKLGEFNFFTSYMSQPKFQLETFKVRGGGATRSPGVGRARQRHLLLPQQPPHRHARVGHAGALPHHAAPHDAGEGAVHQRARRGLGGRRGGEDAGPPLRGHNHPHCRVGELSGYRRGEDDQR